MLRIPPPNEGDEDTELTEELPTGIIHLRLWPKKITSKQLMSDAPIATFDNSEVRIRNAVRKKRGQVRSSEKPVLLAIQASGICSGFDDFDMALFGRGFARYDEHHRLMETGFTTDGIFNELRDKPPTYAGVLAFLTVGFNTCSSPVLYLHPRFSGILPEALLQLEQRMYNNKSNEIQIQPSRTQGLVERFDFVNV